MTGFIDTDEAPNKFAAAYDAQRRNANAKSKFTNKQIAKAYGVEAVMSGYFKAKDIYTNFRDGGKTKRPKFITVKIDNPTWTDTKRLEAYLKSLDSDPDLTRPVRVRESAQGINFNIYLK